MTSRRNFCKQLGALGALASAPQFLFANHKEELSFSQKKDEMIWCYLIHLGYNLWEDYRSEGYEMNTYPTSFSEAEVRKWAHMYQPNLTCEEEVWDHIIEHLAQAGVNMVMIDLADGLKYKTHPEIAVKGAWTPKLLKNKLEKIRALGMEPIPKLNFSTCHKAWTGEYQYCVSSKYYYKFCQDLIEEVHDLFDKPRFIHLGMDEETAANQISLGTQYTVVRSGDLWWKDFLFLVGTVEKLGSRSWIWSDYYWNNPKEFINRMPKSVLQSNWNYYPDLAFDSDNNPTNINSKTFVELEKQGFDQVPTGSLWRNSREWNNNKNFDCLVRHNKRIIAPERLKGFMQTIWTPTLKPCEQTHYRAADLIADARTKYYNWKRK